ncbi:MAG TPA: DUF4386 domain-containing protein [Cryomorphaceae bacterium]|nr:hypothetical protein [Owenweeksia sp.]MBF97830.1 hypothetical protein [Owenweeksia sp.]HAD96765.1 DUF4386 domain-containing protein [Cryomorphaceae bacterium]HBF20854.1 DUF4386 domain-containing protein [Cryomorphaceae bacterium]HCQ16365.1 DUF4386 domain-containing protein [Cryomorphaceae bacterium]|tara:strand:- start:514 stop:1215 length:702 start_codon:yes stop_codon:yes gene_type:complete
MKKSKRISQRASALTAGISLLIMAIVAGLTYGYLHGSLVVADNAPATVSNLQSSTGLFRAELLGWTIIFLLDALVAWALYHFFATTHKGLSFLSSFLRVLYTAILGVAIFNLPQILTLLNEQLSEVGMAERPTDILNCINSFENIWSHGLIIFGLHLVVLGYLSLLADHIHNAWGILLMIAGVSYTLLHTLYAIVPEVSGSLTLLESILAIPMTIGELGFALWLIIKGGKTKA